MLQFVPNVPDVDMLQCVPNAPDVDILQCVPNARKVKIGNNQELIQSNLTPRPQNKRDRSTHKNWHKFA